MGVIIYRQLLVADAQVKIGGLTALLALGCGQQSKRSKGKGESQEKKAVLFLHKCVILGKKLHYLKLKQKLSFLVHL